MGTPKHVRVVDYTIFDNQFRHQFIHERGTTPIHPRKSRTTNSWSFLMVILNGVLDNMPDLAGRLTRTIPLRKFTNFQKEASIRLFSRLLPQIHRDVIRSKEILKGSRFRAVNLEINGRRTRKPGKVPSRPRGLQRSCRIKLPFVIPLPTASRIASSAVPGE